MQSPQLVFELSLDSRRLSASAACGVATSSRSSGPELRCRSVGAAASIDVANIRQSGSSGGADVPTAFGVFSRQHVTQSPTHSHAQQQGGLQAAAQEQQQIGSPHWRAEPAGAGGAARAAMVPPRHTNGPAFSVASVSDPRHRQHLAANSPSRQLAAAPTAASIRLAAMSARFTHITGLKPGRRAELVIRRPDAALALLPREAVLFLAGAVAGAIGKTLTAPLDRVKILLQTKGGMATGNIRAAAAGGGLVDSFMAIGRQEGVRGYWRGNIPQVLRVLPYSACQLCSYDMYKRLLGGPDGERLTVLRRLAAGAAAGMTSTLLTYPLDTLRLRLAVDPSVVGMRGAARALLREGSGLAFYRGIGVAMLGIAPYMALEFAAFDLLPQSMSSFARGFSAALIATTFCYPLDTLRRQIQMQSSAAVPAQQVVRRVLAAEGIAGFYRGFLPNAAKNLPNKGVRLSTFDAAKKMLKKSQASYDDEMSKVAA